MLTPRVPFSKGSIDFDTFSLHSLFGSHKDKIADVCLRGIFQLSLIETSLKLTGLNFHFPHHVCVDLLDGSCM